MEEHPRRAMGCIGCWWMCVSTRVLAKEEEFGRAGTPTLFESSATAPVSQSFATRFATLYRSRAAGVDNVGINGPRHDLGQKQISSGDEVWDGPVKQVTSTWRDRVQHCTHSRYWRPPESPTNRERMIARQLTAR
jgi:hypothetical protein